MYWYRRLPHWVPENSTVFVTWRVVVCRKQNSEYALDCGAANPGCRRLSAGADRLTIGPQDTILPHQTPAAKTAGATSWSLQGLKMYKLQAQDSWPVQRERSPRSAGRGRPASTLSC